MIVDKWTVAIDYVTSGASAALGVYGRVSAVITAGTAAIVGYTIAQAASIDETAKSARALDLTTEAYTRLTFAADRAGVNQEQLRSSLGALTQRIAAAARGGAEAQDAFRALGVEWETADGKLKTSAQLLPEIATSMEGIDDTGLVAAARVQLLGESGARMASLLDGGGEAIRAMGDRAEELGAVLDSAVAVASERLTDSVTDLRASLSGLGLQIMEVTLPPVTALVEGLTSLVSDSDGLVQVGLDRAMRGLGIAADIAESPMGRLGLAVTAVAGVVSIGGPLLSGLGAAIPALRTFAGASLTALWPLGLLAAAAGLVYVAIDDVIVTAQGGDSVIRRFADALGVGEETAYALAEAGDLVGAVWDGMIVQGQGLVAILGEIGDGIAWVVGQVLDLDLGFGSIRDAIHALIGEIPDLGGAIRMVGDAFGLGADRAREWTQWARGGADTDVSGSIISQTLGGASRRQALGGSALAGGGSAGLAAIQDTIAGADGSSLSPGMRQIVQQNTLAGGISVNIERGGDALEVSRRAAEQVQDQTYRALSALEGG